MTDRNRPHWRDTYRYRFDTFMAKGGKSAFIGLMVLFLGFWVVLGLIRGLLYWGFPQGAENVDGFFAHLWLVFLHMMDPGTMLNDVPYSPIYKIVTVASGLVGVVILSMLIGFVTTALSTKLSELRKGHSRVLERGHTLILGWNERVVEIIRELVIANESEKDGCVVILADRDKVLMDDEIDLRVQQLQTTRVVTRSGNTSSQVALHNVAVTECRSIIVLATCTEAASDLEKMSSDAKVIKTILALMNVRPEGRQFNIVAEIYSERNRSIVQHVAPGEITTLDTGEILAKILVQTSRSSGLSVVYTELLSFDGCEMYFYNDPRWAGKSFSELQYHFPDGVPIGLRTAGGEILVRPDAQRVMRSDDDILIVAEDNSTIEFRAAPVATARELTLKPGRLDPTIERNLILGWNEKASTIISEYEQYVQEDSTIVVMVREPSAATRAQIYATEHALSKINLFLLEEDPMDTRALMEVKPFSFNNIIILSQDPAIRDPEKTDSETIILLLMIRDIFQKHPQESKRTKLITEVMNSENMELVSRAGVNDFIISNRFVSMIFAQISEEKDMKRVYDDLFQEDGSEIYLKPASLYFDELPIEVSFADLMRIAQQRDEVCIGVKIKALEKLIDKNFGVDLIPEKNTRYTLQPNDSLVVFSEDDT